MAQRVFFLNRLREGVDPAEYEAWIRRVDYPVARAQDAIRSYTVTRIDGTLSGEGESPHDYLEVIEIGDLETYRALASLPAFEQLLAEWSQYVAEAVMIHGEDIE
jgi:REDY-like protein HapK